MKYRVIIHRRAMDDIRSAAEWLASNDSAAALRWYEGILAAIRSLETNPERFEVAPESQHLPITIRHALYGTRSHKYRIVFSIRLDHVHIWTVRHAARNWLAFEDLLGEGA